MENERDSRRDIATVRDGAPASDQMKKEIRKRILAIRNSMPAGESARYDAVIRERILAHPAYKEAQIILAYASYRSEVDTSALIRQALLEGKNVFAPKVSGNAMEFWQITSMNDLRAGYRGIPEPAERISLPEWLDTNLEAADADRGTIAYKAMLWMPGAVFDRERHRIGYGGGFYDRYLSRLTGGEEPAGRRHLEVGCAFQKRLCQGRLDLVTAALAYNCQVLDQIPYEPHDIRPDMIVTEEGVILA